MQMILNGSFIEADLTDSLSRAVIISLFSWRRADPKDDYDGSCKMGWWADQYGSVTGDRIGSKLWELLRQKLTSETIARAQEYSAQALQWMIDDGLCEDIQIEVERDSDDVNRLNLSVKLLYTSDNQDLFFEFKDITNGND